MRILVLSDQWFPDFKGGTARVVTATSRALVARGHSVTAIVPAKPGGEPIDEPGGLTVMRVLPRGRVPQTVGDHLMTRRVVARLPPQAYDVVLAHNPSCLAGALDARLPVPVSYVFHASPAAELRFRRSHGIGVADAARSRAMEPILAYQERKSLVRCDGVLVLSEFSRRLVCDISPRAVPVHVAGGGVDTSHFRPPDDRVALRARYGFGAEDFVILSARRLIRRMGIENLLVAFQQLIGPHPRLRLVIVGDGELAAELEGLAGELGLSEAVSFTGAVPDSALVEWYGIADLFVLPTVAYEGFGMVTAEALACGTPVVGTRAGATPELLGALSPELLCSESTPEGLGSGMERGMTLASGLRSACRAFALEHLDWNTVIERWEREIAAVAAQTTNRGGHAAA